MRKGIIILLFWYFYSQINGQILLQVPVNGQDVQTPTPYFDWTDVSGINRYYIKIVGLGSETSPIAALNNNPSVHQNIVYGSSAYYYPVTATALTCNEEYAWIIYTVNNENRNNHDLGDLNSYIQYISAPSTFRIACSNIVPNSQVKKPYFELSSEINPFIYETPDDTLRVKFKIPYNVEYVTYKVMGKSGAHMLSTDSLAVNYGVNYLSLKLDTVSVSAGQPYSIYIDNGKGQFLQGRFKRKE